MGLKKDHKFPHTAFYGRPLFFAQGARRKGREHPDLKKQPQLVRLAALLQSPRAEDVDGRHGQARP